MDLKAARELADNLDYYDSSGGSAPSEAADVIRELASEIERQAAVIADARKIIEELCACYGHPAPMATLWRMTPN